MHWPIPDVSVAAELPSVRQLTDELARLHGLLERLHRHEVDEEIVWARRLFEERIRQREALLADADG